MRHPNHNKGFCIWLVQLVWHMVKYGYIGILPTPHPPKKNNLPVMAEIIITSQTIYMYNMFSVDTLGGHQIHEMQDTQITAKSDYAQ